MKGKLLLALCLLLSFSCLPYAIFSCTKVRALNLPVHNINTGLDYATIREAINANETRDGNTIRVDAGTYYEHVTINKSIALLGEGSNTIIDGNGTGTVIQITADYVKVSDFTVRNAGPNFQPGVPGMFDACISGRGLHDIDVENNVLLNAGAAGITIGESYSVNVTNNIVSNIVGLGVIISNNLPVAFPQNVTENVTVNSNMIRNVGYNGIELNGNSQYCRIANNTVQDCSQGIALGDNMMSHIVPSNNLVDGNILSNNSADNMLISSGLASYSQLYCRNTFRNNNLTNANHNNLIVWGYNLPIFMQDIESSNTANGKRIYWITNGSGLEIDPSNHEDAGYLALVNCTNVTAKDFDFAGNKDGLLLAGSRGCTVTSITVGNNRLYMTAMNASTPSYWGGLTLFASSNNTMENCDVCNQTYGVSLYHSDWNLFYHNSFVGNDRNVVSDYDGPGTNVSSEYISTNFWDNGVEGNYWSNYNGTDANHNGLGNTPYVIDEKNMDHYPLMGAFNLYPVPVYGHPPNSYDVTVISNSTITGFLTPISLDTPYPEVMSVSFNVTGKEGSTGFCRVSIPTAVMNGTYHVFVNGTEIPFTLLPCSNATVSYLHFTYKQSTEQVIILPELPSFLILPQLMIATLVGAMMLKRKRRSHALTVSVCPHARSVIRVLVEFHPKPLFGCQQRRFCEFLFELQFGCLQWCFQMI